MTGGNAVVPICALVYLGGCAITAVVTYVISQWLAEGPITPSSALCFSVLMGLVWPLAVIGVVELSSVAVYAAAKSWRQDAEIPDTWLRADAFDNVVVPLR